MAHEGWLDPLVTGGATGAASSDAVSVRATSVLADRTALIPVDEFVSPPVVPQLVLTCLLCPRRT